MHPKVTQQDELHEEDPSDELVPNMANESTPRRALEDFLEILLKNGGEFDLGDVVKQLSSQNRRLVSDFGKLEFVKRYPELFDYKLCREVGKSKPKVMAKLDVPLQFCIEAGESGGCASKECTRLYQGKLQVWFKV